VNGKDALAIRWGAGTVHSASRTRPVHRRRRILRSGLPLPSVLPFALLRPGRRLAARPFRCFGQASNVRVRTADVSSHRPEAYGAIVRCGFAARFLRATAEEKRENVRHSDLRSSSVPGSIRKRAAPRKKSQQKVRFEAIRCDRATAIHLDEPL